MASNKLENKKWDNFETDDQMVIQNLTYFIHKFHIKVALFLLFIGDSRLHSFNSKNNKIILFDRVDNRYFGVEILLERGLDALDV
jgi:hypothetical protein